MAKAKKISFPKIKKKLKSFLTDESGKITKKDALWIAAVWAIIATGEWASAAHSSTACTHASQAALGA